ncbi:hypothetical protein BBP00_00000835 [Phytophthora kernoviae]|uniref:RNB domain-containing protein n=1 Tax=Phytophthora kernoviae TaxID=325452 RepID=A0A3F2S303_9STRA|nr:hypothetical protein BBP00_00000835 [Phytophthora kernoviae]
MANTRVKVSWQEALGVEDEREEKPPGPKPKSKSKPKPKPDQSEPKRKKRHPNDVKTEQDMDAIAGFDESSSDELDSEIDTFGGAGFVLIDLEKEMEELALVATEEGFAHVRIGGKSQKKKKSKAGSEYVDEVNTSTEKEKKKRTKKMKQGKKLLETVEKAGGEKMKKPKKSKKGGREVVEIVEKQIHMKEEDDFVQLKKTKTKRTKKDKVEETQVHKNKGKQEQENGKTKSPKKKQQQKKKMKDQKDQKEEQVEEVKEKEDSFVKRGADKSTPGSESGQSKKNVRDNGKVVYAEYLDHDVVIKGLEMGGLLQGKLRVNSMYRMDGYITVNGLAMDVLVKGMEDRNRGLDGDLVVIRLHPESEWKPLNNENESSKIVGEYTGIETGISAILSKHGLQEHTLDFDSAILDELDEKYGTSGEKWEVPAEELQKRRDFRDTQIFSIDPYNARDLDDALHIRALDNARTRFEVGVHIADVTHFIEHNSLLDKEARSRATSVYLANRVLPMLPRILCEKLCSLQPQVDRLAFSVVWQMNVDGTLVEGVEPWFGKSIIRSCCKLDYGSAQKMLDGIITSNNVDEWEEDRRPIPGVNPDITNATVIQSVQDLWSVGENRRAMRFDTGAVSLNDVKIVFSLDAKGNPTRYGSYELKDSNRLVEEYMLLANFLVAQQLLRAHGPLAFLRHHPPPVARAMDLALEQLDKNDISLDGRSTKQLSESLEQVRQARGETIFTIVQALIIKPMKPAEYMVAGNGASSDSWRHYALNIPYYTHFTSPIRRYADVVVHRLLQESVTTGEHQAPEDNGSASNNADLEARHVEFTSVAQNCNEKKMTSKNAEKECDQVFLCAYVQHHGDVEVTGVVLSMGQKSFTMYILELGLEQRLFLHDMHLSGSWNEKTSQLSIRLPSLRKSKEKTKNAKDDENEKTDDDAVHDNAKDTPPSELIKLSFMKQLRMRMSATKKMPLALTFSVIGEMS